MHAKAFVLCALVHAFPLEARKTPNTQCLPQQVIFCHTFFSVIWSSVADDIMWCCGLSSNDPKVLDKHSHLISCFEAVSEQTDHDINGDCCFMTYT